MRVNSYEMPCDSTVHQTYTVLFGYMSSIPLLGLAHSPLYWRQTGFLSSNLPYIYTKENFSPLSKLAEWLSSIFLLHNSLELRLNRQLQLQHLKTPGSIRKPFPVSISCTALSLASSQHHLLTAGGSRPPHLLPITAQKAFFFCWVHFLEDPRRELLT